MTDRLGEAAMIALVGVAVVMATLAILMVAIMLITRLAPASNKRGEKAVSEAEEWRDQEKEQVAAIVVAMALAMEGETPQQGGQPAGASKHSSGRWGSSGRERLMAARRAAGRDWGRPSR